MDTEKQEETKFYHYLVVGNVVIDKDDQIQAIPQNALMVTDHMNLGIHQLGKAQQALQVTLFNKLGEPANVVDVIITNVVLLGHMTHSEFNARPEGLEVRERPQESAQVIDITKVMRE